MCESRGGRPGLPVPNSPYRLRGRKATLSLNGGAADAVFGRHMAGCAGLSIQRLYTTVSLVSSTTALSHPVTAARPPQPLYTQRLLPTGH